MDSIKRNPEDRLLCMFIWGIASELTRLDGLQEFTTVSKQTDYLDIKQTAEILAEAQLKLRKLANRS